MDCLRRIQTLLSYTAEDDASPIGGGDNYHFIYNRLPVPYSNAEAKIRKNIELLSESKVPNRWPVKRGFVNRSPSGFIECGNEKFSCYKTLINDKFAMWALIDLEWTKKLCREIKSLGIKTCLEVGGGRGWLSKAMSEHSIDMICTDIESRESVYDVEEIDGVSAIDKYGETADALVISWPHDNASEFIKKWSSGKWVIYIGESPTGCNAYMDFFENFKLHKVIEVPTWDYLHDACLIGRRTECSDDFNSKGCLRESLRHLFPEKISNCW
ncbi:MAG: hypothetical protein HAW66_04665 [Shewanella sp.]|nr:hypothetical protein [Shewanella sp.]